MLNTKTINVGKMKTIDIMIHPESFHIHGWQFNRKNQLVDNYLLFKETTTKRINIEAVNGENKTIMMAHDLKSGIQFDGVKTVIIKEFDQFFKIGVGI